MSASLLLVALVFRRIDDDIERRPLHYLAGLTVFVWLLVACVVWSVAR